MVPSDMQMNKEDILNLLYQSEDKLTPRAYIKKITSKMSVSPSEAKKMIHQLIHEQELAYHYLYGSTYIEKCFLRPVRMTDHFVLKPPGIKHAPGQDDIEIIIEQGLAFGSGQHPTTQLCLEAIEFSFFKNKMIPIPQTAKGLDIGTGSGVLAMAMCLSGLGACNAYEIDPVAINEARRNVGLNRLKQKINVIGTPLEDSRDPVSVVTANLRFPTLKTLSGIISKRLINEGVAILSGVREWEKHDLMHTYSDKGFDLVWQRDEKKWSAFVLEKKIC